MTAGSFTPSSLSMLIRPSFAALEARMNCSRRGVVRGMISARLSSERTSQKVL